MKQFKLFVFWWALSALVLSGCTLPTPTPVVTPTVALVTCPTGSLQAVTLVDPPMWGTVASLNPTLHWTYPDPSCSPEAYAIRLKTGPLFTDDLGGGTGTSATSWGPASALEPGKEYEWAVEPINGTTLGPVAGFNYFFTGPTCDTADLVAPILLQPPFGGTFNYNQDALIWDYAEDCAPQGYRVDLSTDPSFADTSLSGGTGNPSTRWGPGTPLTDCQEYFWRTAAINGTTLGPFSASSSFIANSGAASLCPSPTPFPGGPTPTSAPSGAGLFFHLDKNAFCRQGPGQVYKDTTAIQAGETVHVLGRSEDSLWLFIQWDKFNVQCWIGMSTGHANVSLLGVPIRLAPPTPTPTPAPARPAKPTKVPTSTGGKP